MQTLEVGKRYKFQIIHGTVSGVYGAVGSTRKIEPFDFLLMETDSGLHLSWWVRYNFRNPNKNKDKIDLLLAAQREHPESFVIEGRVRKVANQQGEYDAAGTYITVSHVRLLEGEA